MRAIFHGRHDSAARAPTLIAHYGVPMAGAVINTLNVRLDARIIAFSLDHAEAKAVLVERELAHLLREALPLMRGPRPLIVDVVDPTLEVDGEIFGELEFEELLAEGDPEVAGTYVCLRQVRDQAIWDTFVEHDVTHLCGAPIVMSVIANAPANIKRPLTRTIEFMTAGAPPPEATLAAMAQTGFNVTHLYGLTESYGPAVVNEWHDEWDALDSATRAGIKARQGVRYQALEQLTVMDPETMTPVPADGETLGEVMMRGNVIMKGYLKNPRATGEAFAGGWFHTGDLAVMHPDGYIQLKDRSKDIIISGGENISSIEVEDALYKHAAVQAAAVVAMPDDKWGETPCAFVELRPEASAEAAEIIAWCREQLAHFKCPRRVVFGELPRTSTGKIQKFKLRERARALVCEGGDA